MYVHIYSIALGSVRPGRACIHLGTDEGMAAFFSMVGLFAGDSHKSRDASFLS